MVLESGRWLPIMVVFNDGGADSGVDGPKIGSIHNARLGIVMAWMGGLISVSLIIDISKCSCWLLFPVITMVTNLEVGVLVGCYSQRSEKYLVTHDSWCIPYIIGIFPAFCIGAHPPIWSAN